jgi:transcriptional regulator with XRE-family HTH domain
MRCLEENRTGKSFSAELFRLRTAQGRTQRDIARAAGIARSYYSELENERRRPPRTCILEKIISALSLPTADSYALRELAEVDRRKMKYENRPYDLPTLLKLISTATALSEDKIQRIQSILEEK